MLAVGDEQRVAELLSQSGERSAQRMARFVIGCVTPKASGERITCLLFGMQQQIGKQRFDLAPRKGDRRGVLFDAQGAQQIDALRLRGLAGEGRRKIQFWRHGSIILYLIGRAF